MRTLGLCVLLGLLSMGCGKDEVRGQPLPPDAGAGSGGVGGFPSGGHGGHDDEDSGDRPTDAGNDAEAPLAPGFVFGECVNEGTLPSLTNQITMPTDFAVTRGYAHWIGSCGDPVLQIGLSDGRCPNGNGHELVIEIDADAITNGTLFIPGGNQVNEERPDRPIRIRYFRPPGLVPAGTWGTCNGVFGEVVIESLAVDNEATLRADVGLTLAACDIMTTPSTFAVVGSFNLTLQRALTEICPP